ncbi:MAG TPA: polysaccharide biosynthesis/export family protein [Polyangiaceae bacterium]
MSCARHVPSASYADAVRTDPRRQPYVIGPADVVRITVWKDPALSTEAVVRPDGTITLPASGEMRAAGRTVADLQKETRARVAALVNDPVVSVAVVEVNSYRFTVAGNVEHPGLFSSRYYLTVSEAIALAGGPNRYASTSDVVIVRSGARGLERIRIDYDGILNGRNPEQDVVLLAGDSVRVP